ncbi:DUF6151 family protein [Pendulispora albinea]|uniref:DUF6151 family protein n=1 Tax=Pendulispora albinea TaxID=2741071 RepID=A0ABZ2LZ58_9BACT
MSRDVELRCRCGEIRGHVANAAPRTVNRVVCYCDDCQAFLHYLGRADLFDAQGGTDIVQVAPASLVFERGAERIEGVRLTAKGLYRWYAGCCKTPVGNTLGPAIPFVGLVAQTFEGGSAAADDIVGKPIGAILGKFAIGTPPAGSTSLNVRLIARTAKLLIGWRLGGQTWPHPFFDRATRTPLRPAKVLTIAERDALRPLCGPHPAVASHA